MMYEKIQLEGDKKCGVFRVDDVVFDKHATDSEIADVFREIQTMSVLAPGLMTAKALAAHSNLPKYVVNRMNNMPCAPVEGSSLRYEDMIITRWSHTLFNAKRAKR